MIAKLAALRVSLAIVFGGALLVMFLIKLSSYWLPKKFYFTFSSLIAGGAEPFIVDPPSITANKLCDFMAKHNISRKAFSSYISCSAEKPTVRAFNAAEQDKIYSLALQSDNAVRQVIGTALRGQSLKHLNDAQVRDIISSSGSLEDIIDGLVEAYKQQVSTVADASASQLMNTIYDQSLPSASEPASGEEEPLAHLDDATVSRILRANVKLGETTSSADFANNLAPITKSAIDKIINHTNDREDLKNLLIQYYVDAATAKLQPRIAQEFSDLGIQRGEQAKREQVFNEIIRFSIWNYLISILLRILPVVLFGLLLGFILADRNELLSISLAAGLAAFLLCWPLILMWDRLVQSHWVDKKNIFLLFYTLYVLSFYLAARASAIVGIYLRGPAGGLLPAAAAQKVDTGLQVTWREVATNVAGAVVINSAVYVWNVMIPLR